MAREGTGWCVWPKDVHDASVYRYKKQPQASARRSMRNSARSQAIQVKIRELHRCSEDCSIRVPEFAIVVLWNSVLPLCIKSFVCIVCRKHKTMLNISAETKLTDLQRLTEHLSHTTQVNFSVFLYIDFISQHSAANTETHTNDKHSKKLKEKIRN